MQVKKKPEIQKIRSFLFMSFLSEAKAPAPDADPPFWKKGLVLLYGPAGK